MVNPPQEKNEGEEKKGERREKKAENG